MERNKIYIKTPSTMTITETTVLKKIDSKEDIV
jgi:hypothetical protein